MDYKSGMSYADIAKQHKVSIDTVRSWQRRHWSKLDVQNNDDNVQDVQNSHVSCANHVQALPAKPVNKGVKDVVQTVVAKQVQDTSIDNVMGYSRDNLPAITPQQERFVQEYM
jgi:uncharacterized protein YjcR